MLLLNSTLRNIIFVVHERFMWNILQSFSKLYFRWNFFLLSCLCHFKFTICQALCVFSRENISIAFIRWNCTKWYTIVKNIHFEFCAHIDTEARHAHSCTFNNIQFDGKSANNPVFVGIFVAKATIKYQQRTRMLKDISHFLFYCLFFLCIEVCINGLYSNSLCCVFLCLLC